MREFGRSSAPVLVLLALGLVGNAALGPMSASAQPFAYVSVFEQNVSVIDTATNTVVATVPVGSNPAGVAITPSGAFAYVVNHASNTVSVIATATNTVVATVPVGPFPRSVAITPGGASAYVTNLGSSFVSVINTATNTVVANVGVGGGPFGVAITPDGAFAYVTNSTNTVSVIRHGAYTVVATVPVGTSPRELAITPGGAFAYVANESSNTVSVIATATNTVVATVPVGGGPFGVAITPDGAFAYVTNASSNTVSVIATATNTVVATVPVGGLPLGIAIKPGGAFAYVANRAGTVSVINTATNTVVATVPVGPPTGVAITPTPLVGWWPAEGNANDVQGGNNGTLQGGMTFSTGEIGQAFSFNGIDADVKVSASAATDVGTSGGFTVGAWIAPTDTSFLRPLVEWNNNANGIGAHLWLEPGGVIFTNIFDTGGAEHVVRSPSGSVCAGVFQHVALTYDKASGVATIYANAAIVAQQAVGQFTPQTSYDLYFGVRPSSPFGDAGIRFSGSMDEVQLFNLALTQAEVQAIVDAGSPRICQAITVTAPAPASAAFNTSFGVAATSSSGLAVAITTTGGCSGSGSGSATITMLSGTTACEVHYNQAGDSDYSAAPEVTSSTTAQKASQTITVTQGAPATGGTRRSSRWRRQRQEARWH